MEEAEELKKIQEAGAWSMENMAAHGAGGRDTTYIGSDIQGRRIFDYYRDSAGCYWYRNRIVLSDGTAVSEKEAIFGKKGKK